MPPTAEIVREELKQVFDPEIPVNIVDLGLIYDIRIEGGTCEIDMTLTSQACPAAQAIPEVVQSRVSGLEGIDTVKVQIVWDPPWTVQEISPEGRKILGIDPPPSAE